MPFVPARLSTFELLLDHIFGWDDGLICGGSVRGLILPRAGRGSRVVARAGRAARTASLGSPERTDSIAWVEPDSTGEWLYQETVSPASPRWIAGSGHIAQAVAPLALRLEFAVTVFDDRPGLANHGCLAPEVVLRVGGWHDLLREASPSGPNFGLIVTRGHQHDALVLSEWIDRPFVFLGMIGSQRKARLIREQFLHQGVASAAGLARLTCPVGLPIHARSTEEIAVSILAQCIQTRGIPGSAGGRQDDPGGSRTRPTARPTVVRSQSGSFRKTGADPAIGDCNLQVFLYLFATLQWVGESAAEIHTEIMKCEILRTKNLTATWALFLALGLVLEPAKRPVAAPEDKRRLPSGRTRLREKKGTSAKSMTLPMPREDWWPASA